MLECFEQQNDTDYRGCCLLRESQQMVWYYARNSEDDEVALDIETLNQENQTLRAEVMRFSNIQNSGLLQHGSSPITRRYNHSTLSTPTPPPLPQPRPIATVTSNIPQSLHFSLQDHKQ